MRTEVAPTANLRAGRCTGAQDKVTLVFRSGQATGWKPSRFQRQWRYTIFVSPASSGGDMERDVLHLGEFRFPVLKDKSTLHALISNATDFRLYWMLNIP